jgi:putative PIN family toxin of toxin-antitoxin system
MAKPKVVIDTNVLVRILRSPAGRSLILKLSTKLCLYTNDYLLAECEDVLSRKFGYTKQRSKTATARYRRMCTMVNTSISTDKKSGIRDQNDEPIVQLCKQADIDVLVTDDKDFVAEVVYPTKIIGFGDLKEILEA